MSISDFHLSVSTTLDRSAYECIEFARSNAFPSWQIACIFARIKETGGRDRDEKENNKIYISSPPNSNGSDLPQFSTTNSNQSTKVVPFITRPVLPAENFQTFLVLRPRLRGTGRALREGGFWFFENRLRHDRVFDVFENCEEGGV